MPWLSWLFWWRPPCLLRAVIVNLKSGHDAGDLRGVLWQSRGAWLVLKDATWLKPGAEPAPIDGEAVIHRSNVAFLQVLP